MANFEAISEDTSWPAMPKPRFIPDTPISPLWYNQDEAGTDSIATGTIAAQLVQMVNESDRYNAAAAHDRDLLPDSLKWPSAALRDQEATPFVVFTGTVIVLPAWDASIGIGAAVVAAYVAGCAAYYLQNYCRPAKTVVPTSTTQIAAVQPHTVQAQIFIPNRRPLPTPQVTESLGEGQLRIAA